VSLSWHRHELEKQLAKLDTMYSDKGGQKAQQSRLDYAFESVANYRQAMDHYDEPKPSLLDKARVFGEALIGGEAWQQKQFAKAMESHQVREAQTEAMVQKEIRTAPYETSMSEIYEAAQGEPIEAERDEHTRAVKKGRGGDDYTSPAGTHTGLTNAQIAWWEDGCNYEPDGRPYPDADELAAPDLSDPASLHANIAPAQQVAADDRAHAEELAARLWAPSPDGKPAVEVALADQQQTKSRGMGR
jgi:hypothetical protein